jgi:hypothetical protein
LSDERRAPLAHNTRFLTDAELRSAFGLSERALQQLRILGGFLAKDSIVKKTDRKLVDRFFDIRSGVEPFTTADGQEHWDFET